MRKGAKRDRLTSAGLALACAHESCSEMLSLTLSDVRLSGKNPAISDELRARLGRALWSAAEALGWRIEQCTPQRTLCHNHTQGLVCARCYSAECSCIGGPSLESVRVAVDNN